MRNQHRWNGATAAALLLCATGCASQASKQAAEEARAPAPSPAKAPGELRPKVEALLSGYERIPTDEDWKRLGPEALGVLLQIYQDPAQLPSTRTRAVASLAQVDNPAAVDALKAIVADAAIEAQYRSTAVLALGARTGEKALPQLQPLLEDKSPQLRDAASRAIGKVGTQEARKSLEERPIEGSGGLVALKKKEE